MPVYVFNSFLNKFFFLLFFILKFNKMKCKKKKKINRYGMKNMAETKFILLMISAKNYE